MRKLFWILLIAVIAFLIVYGVVPEVKAPVDAFLSSVGGQTATAVGAWWAGVASNELYIQYHVLIWLAGGVLLTVAVMRLWRRRPAVLWNKPPQSVAYQNQPVAHAPTLIPQPQAAAPTSPQPVVQDEPPKEATA